MPGNEQSQSSIVPYQTEDGQTRIQCRFENETIWLTQALIAEMFQKDVQAVNEHLVSIFAESELGRGATIRKFRMARREGELTKEATIRFYLIVRSEGARRVSREVLHCNLPASKP